MRKILSGYWFLLIVCFLTFVINAIAMDGMTAADLSAGVVDDESAPRPNIVFIFSDDHRYDLLGTVNPAINTPCMDKIAKSGICFSNAFVTTAICSPSRASTMTGHYGSTNGVTALSQHISPDELTFANHLSNAGYRTSVIGKWHVGNSPADLGFQEWAYFTSNGSWFNRKIHTNIDGAPSSLNGQFIEAFNADRAIDYIDDHVTNHSTKPFVIWLCNQVPHVDGRLKYAVHNADTDGPEIFAQYNVNDMSVPGNWNDDLVNKPPYLLTSVSSTKSAAQNYGGPGGYTNKESGVRNKYLGQDNVQNHNKEYYASITWWDQEMGRVLNRLGDPDGDGDTSDSILDNTWIIFMGDNGWFTGHHKFTSKVLTYEESMRVPMFVRPPLNPDGTPSVTPRVEDNLVMNVDLTQLMLDIAGIAIPENMHGLNVNDLIKNENASWRDRVYYESPQAELGGNIHESVRTDSHKYIRTYTDKIGGALDFEELYDLQTDSLEMYNVINKSAYSNVQSIMEDLIQVERQRISANNNTPPACPTGIAISQDETGITLDWADSTERDIAGYMIYRSTTSGNGYEVIATPSTGVTISNYTDKDVTKGTSYYYTISVVDNICNESGLSSEVSGIPHVVGGFIPAAARDVLIKELPVDPGICYHLSFKAETDTIGATWLLRIRNQQGELPYDGCYERHWQQITPGNVSYTHSFQTKPDAATLWFGIRSENAPPKISEVAIEAITPSAMLINGDFSAGKGNYSGWTEHFNTTFVEKDGKPALKVEQNGYVLTDPVPVAGGGQYKYAPRSTMATSILAYDANMHLVEVVPYDRKLAVIKMPENAAYVRLLYQTWHDHIPSYRTKTISLVGLVPMNDIDSPMQADLPRFSGEIIVDAGCDPREERAARELQHWIEQITGKRIAVLAAVSASNNTKIYLGAKWAAKYTDDLKYLADSDGYAVRREGKNIYVFGAHPRGTLFGVYGWLEKNTDIIWPRPNPEFSAVFSKVSDIQFVHSNYRSRPAFKFRELSISTGDLNKSLSQDWRGCNGVNTRLGLRKGFPYLRWRSGAVIGVGGSYIGTFMGLEQDENLYPLVAGIRNRSVWRQPCYTNPEVPKIMAIAARKMLASVPGKKVEYLIARIGDNWDVCACPDCMTPIKLADGTLLATKATSSIRDPLFFSTRNYIMLNAFAEEMVKDYPDLKIHTHAYLFAAEPPKVKLHPAIVPHFAAYPTKDERYPILSQPTSRGAIWGRRFRQWDEEQNVQFGFFGYYYTHGFNALADTASPDYKALADMRGIMVHSEGCWGDTDKLSAWDVDGPEKWVTAKLMWDPYQNPAALRDEYIKRTYQDAALKMREFYQLINDSWHDKTNTTSVNCHTSGNILFQEFIVNPGIESSVRAILDEAQKDAANPTSRKMIQRTLAQFDAYGAALNRIFVPFVPESTGQWGDYASPHWYKAVSIGDFVRIVNWQNLPEDKLAKHKTTVSIMRDKENIYFKIDAFVDDALVAKPISRIDAFPKGDRAEIVLRSGANTYYIAVGGDGGTYLLKNWDSAVPWKNSLKVKYLHLDKNWTALFAVPMSDMELNPAELDLDGKYCRVFAPGSSDREESTYDGREIFRDHKLLRSPLLFK